MATQLDISHPNVIVYDGVVGSSTEAVEVIRQNVRSYLTRIGEYHSVTLLGDAPLVVYLAIFGVLCSIVQRVYWLNNSGLKVLMYTSGWREGDGSLNSMG